MKYRLTENAIEYQGRMLYQIQALEDIQIKREGYFYYDSIEKGELGGYVEKESNLAQRGNCWISKDVYVFDNAQVSGNAFIDCDAIIYENSRVYGNAMITDEKVYRNYHVQISGNAKIYGETSIEKSYLKISGNAQIFGTAQMGYSSLLMTDNAIFKGGLIAGVEKGHITLRDNAVICGGSLDGQCAIYENAVIYGGGVHDNARIYGNAKIYDADICDEAQICGNTEIKFDTNIGGNAYICGNAIVERDEDVMTFSNIGSLALLLNNEITDNGIGNLSFFRAGDQMQMTIGEHFYANPDKFLQHMKLFCQNLQATLEMAEKRFGSHTDKINTSGEIL